MEYIKDNNIINDLSDNFEKNINIKVINNDNLIIKKKKLIELSKNLTKIEYLEIFNIIQEDKKETTPVQKVETVEKIEEKPLKVENPPPKRNRLNDLFSNTPSDKPGKITNVT